jgi:hypothetical protein
MRSRLWVHSRCVGDALVIPCSISVKEDENEKRADLPPAIMSKVLSPLSSQATNAQHVYTLAAVALD